MPSDLKIRTLLLVTVLLFPWYGRTDIVYCNNNVSEDSTVWNISTQLELNRFMENATTYSDKRNSRCYHLLLAGENNYIVDILSLMKIGTNGNLIVMSEGGLAEISCTANKELPQVELSLSRASLVLLDGLIFTGCPVPILIEEASNVVIQNCVFQ